MECPKNANYTQTISCICRRRPSRHGHPRRAEDAANLPFVGAEHKGPYLGMLQQLGLPVTEAEGTVTVTPPSFRFDLQIEEDLIEEVARMVGYNQLPTTPPLAPITAKVLTESRRSPFAVRRLLASQGYQETINFSFVEESWEHGLAGNPNPIKLLNPIASQMSVMRSSLLGSLLQVLKFNQARKQPRVRVFELGRVFLRDAAVKSTDATVEGFDQPMRIAGLASGSADGLQWGRKEQAVDFFDVKGDVEALLAPLQAQFVPGDHPAMHPGRCAQVILNGKAIGFVGELHPQWRQQFELTQAPVLFELDLDAVLQRTDAFFVGLPTHVLAELDQLLGLLASAPGRRFLVGLSTSWEEATAAETTAALKGMLESGTELRIQACQGLHDLVMVPYFSGKESWTVLGYPGPTAV